VSKQALSAVALGLVVVAALIGWMLQSTRKNRVELTGEVLKVRTHQMDPEHTIALIDLRIKNPSTQQFMVRDVRVFIDDSEGKSTSADVFSESDIRRVIDYYPNLGKKYTPGLLRRDRIRSGETTDRSIAFNAPMTDERFAGRKAVRLVIADADGAKTEVVEKR
jgi:hypothetical protein